MAAAFYLRFISCIPGTLTSNFTTNINPNIQPGSIITFIDPAAPLPETVFGCYTVQLVIVLDGSPPDYTVNWTTQEYFSVIDCPTCIDLVRYIRQYKFTACCDPEDVIYFRAKDLITDGTYAYYGLDPNIGLINHHCYQVEEVEITDYTAFYNLNPISATELDPENCESDTCQNACDSCFMLEDCEGLQDPIYTTSAQFLQYADTGQAIIVNGYTNCWTVTTTTTNCDCSISLIPILIYQDCPSCTNPKGYKLTSCADTAEIIYSTDDLAQYVGKIVKTDCGTCWRVEEIDIAPPDVQPVVIVNSYDNCTDCTAVHYKLTDCLGVADPIYTTTDLSDHIGSVITIKYCPNICWIVTLAEELLDTGDVYFDTEYEDCPDCYVAVYPVTCQTATNTGSTPTVISYYDSSGTHQSITLQGGQTTDKTCLLLFDGLPRNIITTNFGECTNGQCPPVEIGPRRKVKPGYDTKACTAEYYEEVMCHYSEWMYKDVLERRYGISNCCPDELMKWEIRKEMLELDVLINPDYTCLPQPDCGCCNPVQLTPRTCGS